MFHVGSYPTFVLTVQNYSTTLKIDDQTPEGFEKVISRWFKLSKLQFSEIGEEFPVYEIEAPETQIDSFVKMILIQRKGKARLVKKLSTENRMTIYNGPNETIIFENVTNPQQANFVINEFSVEDFAKWTPYIMKKQSRKQVIAFNTTFDLTQFLPEFRKAFYFANYSQTAARYFPINETDLPAVLVTNKRSGYYLLITLNLRVQFQLF